VLRAAAGLLVLAHAGITAMIWTMPPRPDAPFDASHSWVLGDSRILAVPLSLSVALGLAIVGAGLILDHGWWANVGLVAGAAAVVFMLTYFNPWLLAGIAINCGITIFAARTLILT
jgi:hypothetical protein